MTEQDLQLTMPDGIADADPASSINEPAPDLSFMAFANAIRARATGLLSAE